MEPSRRYWAIVALVAFLAVGGAAIRRPTLIVGAAVLGGWLLAQQFRFVRGLRSTVGTVDIEQTLSQRTVTAGDSVTVALSVTKPALTTLDLAVTASPPLGTTGGADPDRTVALGGQEATTAFELSLPVAGEFEFDRPRLSATDALGLFRAVVPVGTAESITVEPRAPRDMHIGEAGDRIATGLGEHTSDQRGSGLEPATVRQYTAGDDVRRIDWKATARLNHPHVREFELETDPTTALFVDHRSAMATGRDGQTKLDYAREVALAFVNSARSLRSRVGLYTVGDAGTTNALSPHSSAEHYRRLRRVLGDLRPIGTDETASRTLRPRRTTGETSRAAASLADDESPFGRTLRPYFDARTSYVHRIADQPLARTVRQQSLQLNDTAWSIIVTDDTNREAIRDAVTVGRRGNGQVMVFLTPNTLFEAGGLADLKAAYEAYASFESFRRSLSSLERVSAFEVGPGRRLSAVLSAQSSRRERATPGRGST
ncbi:DUF58 domain-containing protein [Halostella pelagica]|uniref:DUF58 domain-containing protein n=1 Tax=Halostella pelagica TaxID=2583824 RepID=UPI0010821651|nr:DUF58 domain-containing protein [Halostella pelagica]